MGELEFGLTKRGKQTVIHSGFEYWMHRKNIVGQVTWRCCQFQVLKCPAMIKTAGNHVISFTQHTHEGNVATSRARTAVNQMKMTDNAVTPRAAQAAIISQLSSEVGIAMLDKNVVARSLRHYRQACNKTAPSILPPLPTYRHFDVPVRCRDLVLCDLDPDTDNRILGLGESSLLEGLRRSPVWLADGKLKKCPTLFFQVYATSAKAGIKVFSRFCYTAIHPCGHFLMGSRRRLPCRLPVSCRRLLEVNVHLRTCT